MVNLPKRVRLLPVAAVALCALATPGSAPESAIDDGAPTALVAVINRSAPTDDVYNGQFCGAVLIAPDVALTAAHCVEDRSSGQLDVIVSARNLCHGAPIDGERRSVATIIRHPAADARRDVDVALLRLSSPASAAPVALVEAGPGPLSSPGWGRASQGGVPPCLPREVELTDAPPQACLESAERANRAFDEERHLCLRPTAGSPNTCTGDSGSPVFDAADRLVGVVSWGVGCEPTAPGVYVRVAPLRPWIDRHLVDQPA